jgi:putative phosphoesterase
MRHIGVISDTHGLLRSEALDALAGSEVIIHAGDVGDSEILERLAEVAPVHAVRGNTDYGPFGQSLPVSEVVSLGPEGSDAGGPLAYVLHDLEELDLDAGEAGMRVVIYGHSHRPAIEEQGGVLYFNPGAAGHRRFSLPVTVGRLTIDDDGNVTAEILDLGQVP